MVRRWLGTVSVLVLALWITLPSGALASGSLPKAVSTGAVSLFDPGTVNPFANASEVSATKDGGYVVAGSVTGPQVGWVAKFSASGQLQWQHQYGCAESELLSVQPTAGGGYIASGGSQGCNIDCTSGGFNNLPCGWVLKIDASGTPVWQRFFVGAFGAGAFQVRQTSDGGYIVVGSTNNQAAKSFGWVAKLDGDGSAVWQRKIGAGTLAIANSVAQTTDGGYVIGGVSRTGLHAVTVKLDAAGSVMWAKQYDGGVSSEVESVAAIPGGGAVAAGRYSTVIGDQTYVGALLMKLDPSGSIVWQKLYYGSGQCSRFACYTGGSYAAAVRVTSSGGYVISGAANVTLVSPQIPDIGGWLAETEPDGNIVWQSFFAQLNRATGLPYGGSFSGIAQAADGGFVAVGSDDKFNDSSNIVIVKTSPSGNITGCSLLSTALLATVDAGLSAVTVSGTPTSVTNPGVPVSSTSHRGGLTLHKDC